MDIYIKPMKKASLTECDAIYVKDVAEVITTKDVADVVNQMKLLDITVQKKGCYLVSVTDIIKAIKKKYPDYTVSNVGEMDSLVEYSPVKSHDNKYYKWLKIVFVSMILFVGSSTAIMSFYSDGQIAEVFKNTYKVLFGVEKENPMILEIPYSFGLAFGIIMFFNHFLGKKVTDDPTPIEVEISTYETQVADTLIDILDVKSKKGEKNQ